MRKGYVSLHSPRRKFAQVTRTTNTAVDVTLRLDTEDLDAAGLGASPGGRLEAVKVRADDPSAAASASLHRTRWMRKCWRSSPRH